MDGEDDGPSATAVDLMLESRQAIIGLKRELDLEKKKRSKLEDKLQAGHQSSMLKVESLAQQLNKAQSRVKELEDNIDEITLRNEEEMEIYDKQAYQLSDQLKSLTNTNEDMQRALMKTKELLQRSVAESSEKETLIHSLRKEIRSIHFNNGLERLREASSPPPIAAALSPEAIKFMALTTTRNTAASSSSPAAAASPQQSEIVRIVQQHSLQMLKGLSDFEIEAMNKIHGVEKKIMRLETSRKTLQTICGGRAQREEAILRLEGALEEHKKKNKSSEGSEYSGNGDGSVDDRKLWKKKKKFKRRRVRRQLRQFYEKLKVYKEQCLRLKSQIDTIKMRMKRKDKRRQRLIPSNQLLRKMEVMKSKILQKLEQYSHNSAQGNNGRLRLTSRKSHGDSSRRQQLDLLHDRITI
eukprot:jgi/Bigna1/90996/estExt_fgenesh1_pg.C_850061